MLLVGGIGLTAGSAFGAAIDPQLPFSGDDTDTDTGIPPALVGAILGGLFTTVAGGILLAYGAKHDHTVEPRTYTFEAEAPGYAPLRREVTVPRETDGWLELQLTTASSTSTAGVLLDLDLDLDPTADQAGLSPTRASEP